MSGSSCTVRPSRRPFHPCDQAPGGFPSSLENFPALAHVILPDRAGTVEAVRSAADYGRHAGCCTCADGCDESRPLQSLTATNEPCCDAIATRTCTGGQGVDTNHGQAITVFSAAALMAYLCRMTSMSPPGAARGDQWAPLPATCAMGTPANGHQEERGSTRHPPGARLNKPPISGRAPRLPAASARALPWQ